MFIAEIGKNFVDTKKEKTEKELFEKAKILIIEAKKAKADIVKFQVHNYIDEILPNSHIVSPHFNYERKKWVKRNTYTFEFWKNIRNFCYNIGIEFLATPMSRGASILINPLVEKWKIGSGDILDFVMLDYIRKTNKPIILSSGMHTLDELRQSYKFLATKQIDISILHCVSEYPTMQPNLLTIPFLKKEFNKTKIGYSSHYVGIDDAITAIYLGAEIIEKHFTLNRNFWGSDHKVSLLPNEFKKMILYIKNKNFNLLNKNLYGNYGKFLFKGEKKYIKIFEKGLYAYQNISKGQIIYDDMICSMRSKNRAFSNNYNKIINSIANKNYKKYDKI